MLRKVWKALIWCNILILFSHLINGQSLESFRRQDWEPPRIKENSEKPGSYQMAVSSDKKILNKRDEFKVDIYFTGYGKIGLSKVFIIFSDEFFDPSSTYSTSLEVKNGKAVYGAEVGAVSKFFVVNVNGGLRFTNKDSSKVITNYFDIHDEVGSSIVTGK